LAVIDMAISMITGASGWMAAVAGGLLITAVFAAVYHAEVVAHRTGEPFGTLVLAVAVTVIEVALIVAVMISAPAEKAGLARDTVFAAVMITCNGIVGLCLLWGGARHHEQGFQVYGASAALAVLAALTILSLVLPNVSASAPGPIFSTPQLVFAGIVSLVLYGAFVFIQTVRHRDYFLADKHAGADAHAAPPSARRAATSEQDAHEAAEVQHRGVHAACRCDAELERRRRERAVIERPHRRLRDARADGGIRLKRTVLEPHRTQNCTGKVRWKQLLLGGREGESRHGDAGIRVLCLCTRAVDEPRVIEAADSCLERGR